MAHGSVILGVVALLGLAGFLYVFLGFFSKGRGLFLPGVSKCFWCEKKRQVVDLDFMAVNPKQYDVGSCTAFAVDENVSCDKHCMDELKKRSDWDQTENLGACRTLGIESEKAAERGQILTISPAQ